MENTLRHEKTVIVNIPEDSENSAVRSGLRYKCKFPAIKCLLVCVLTGMLISTALRAESELFFIGHFNDRAVIGFGGKQIVIKEGETSKEGIKLLLVSPDSAVVEYLGKEHTLYFSPAKQKTLGAVDRTEIRIWANREGRFRTPGTINGQLVNFIVDTGATTVAMNEIVAKKLGIDFRYLGESTMVVTASGMAPAYVVTLRSVRIGEIEVNNIEATVVEGGFPLEVLLGMSFLSRLETEKKGNLLILRKMR